MRKDNIIETHALGDEVVKIDTHHAKENISKIKEIMGDCKSILVFIDHGQMTIEARKMIQNSSLGFEKIAMVAKGPVQKMIGNFFLGINRPATPIQLFQNEDKAVHWLKS